MLLGSIPFKHNLMIYLVKDMKTSRGYRQVVLSQDAKYHGQPKKTKNNNKKVIQLCLKSNQKENFLIILGDVNNSFLDMS
jgi:hypothetical protein